MLLKYNRRKNKPLNKDFKMDKKLLISVLAGAAAIFLGNMAFSKYNKTV